MTFKMGCNFFWLALDLRELFNTIFIDNYIKSNKTLYTVIALFLLCHNVLKLYFINYECEMVNTKVFCIQTQNVFNFFQQLSNY